MGVVKIFQHSIFSIYCYRLYFGLSFFESVKNIYYTTSFLYSLDYVDHYLSDYINLLKFYNYIDLLKFYNF